MRFIPNNIAIPLLLSIYFSAGCKDRDQTEAKLRQVQHTMDSINHISFQETQMTPERFDTLRKVYLKLSREKQILLDRLGSTEGLKHDD